MVTLHNANALELRNFDCFMTMLHHQFEDSLADQKARDHIKTVRQGCRAIAEYIENSMIWHVDSTGQKTSLPAVLKMG